MTLREVSHKYLDCPSVLMEGYIENNPSGESNGAGKSSFIEAHVWLNFGKVMREIESIDDVIGIWHDVGCLVEQCGRKDGKPYILRRTRNHKKYGTGVYLEYDGQEISARKSKDSEELIQNFFGYSYNDYVTSILFTRRSAKFAGMSASEKTATFENALDISKYRFARELLKERISKKRQLVMGLENRLSALELELGTNKKTLQEQLSLELQEENSKQEKLLKLSADIESKKFSITAMVDEISHLDSGILNENIVNKEKEISDLASLKNLELTEVLSPLEKSLEDYLKQESEIKNSKLHEEKINNCKEGIDAEKWKLGRLDTDFDHKFLKKTIEDAKNLISNRKQECENLKNSIDGILKSAKCPTCEREYEEKPDASRLQSKLKILEDDLGTRVCSLSSYERDFKEARDDYSSKLLQKIHDYESEIKYALIDRESDSKYKLETLEVCIKGVRLNIDSTKISIDAKFEEKWNTLLGELKKLQECLDKFKNKQSEISVCRAEIDLMTSNKKSIEEQRNPISVYVESLKNSRVELKNSMKLTAALYVNQKGVLKRMESLDHTFSPKGIPSFIVESMIPYMNQRAQYYSEQFTYNTIQVEFTSQKELKSGETRDEIGVKVLSSNGGNKYGMCSEGELKRADIIIQFVLDDVRMLNSKCNFNIRFYDELLDAMDQLGGQLILATLQKLNAGRTIYIVSHVKNLSDIIPKRLLFHKIGKVTFLKEF